MQIAMEEVEALGRDRVREHSPGWINRRIDGETLERVRHAALAGPEAVSIRLEELDREWDMERALETTAASLALAGILLARATRGQSLRLSATVLGFLLLHAAVGWCPPVSFFRRLGVRTRQEIDRERFALQAP